MGHSDDYFNRNSKKDVLFRPYQYFSSSRSNISKADKKPPKILLVDDDLIIQRIHRIFLTDLGCKVSIACSGEEALKNFYLYNLVFLDINLPGISGIEVCKRIREVETRTQNHIPIIAITAQGSEIEKQCQQAGFDDFVTKPVDEDTFARLLSRWLLKRSQKHETSEIGNIKTKKRRGYVSAIKTSR